MGKHASLRIQPAIRSLFQVTATALDAHTGSLFFDRRSMGSVLPLTPQQVESGGNMRRHVSWLIWPTMLTLILAAAIAAGERGQGTVAQGDVTAVPTNVDGSGEPTVVEYSHVVPTVREIVIPTLATGEPTPDYSLPPDASLDAPGIPALSPEASDGTSEFTVAEIVAFLGDEPHPYADSQYASPEIVDLKVLPAIEAAYVIGGAIHRPEDALVLVVEFEGHFYAAGPVGYALTGQSSYMVFDAQTGNLLMVTVGE